MLKIQNDNLQTGNTFFLQKSWKTILSRILNEDEKRFSSVFKFVEKNDDKYLCESVSNNKIQIYISKYILLYSNGIDVPDVNVGLYFTDYMPLENSKLLLLNTNNTILPAMLKLSITTKNNIPMFDFVLVDLLSEAELPIQGQINSSWKLLHDSDVYMSDTEKMYQDTFVHKEYVMKVCDKFTKYLEDNGLYEEAKQLRKRAIAHDNSKILNHDEFVSLTRIINDKDCLGDANALLSASKQKSIELHWKHNSHHPEHYANYEDMTKLDRLEMVCDWMARSLQFKNNLVEFVETRQKTRFHFPKDMYEELIGYCIVLEDLFK